MRNLALACAVALMLSACALFTAIETKKLPTGAELKDQLAADRAALAEAGCAVEEGAQIAAAIDPTGQRIAQVTTVSGRVCTALSAPVSGPSS